MQQNDLRDPELEKKNHWYGADEINKITKAYKISEGVEVDLTHAMFSPNVALHPGRAPDITLSHAEYSGKKVIMTVAPYRLDQPISPQELQEGISRSTDQLLNQPGASRPRTFVFQVHMGNNHWGPVAYNTDGEILILNSRQDYKEWDDAVVTGIRDALGKNNIAAQLPIRMTPMQRGDHGCGPITVAVSGEIDANRSFAAQAPDLETKMGHICNGDGDEGYETLRQKQRNLAAHINSVTRNPDKKPTDDQKNAIIAELAKPNYPAKSSDDDTLDSSKDSSKKSSQKPEVNQNGKQFPPRLVIATFEGICRKKGLPIIRADSGGLLIKNGEKTINIKLLPGGKISASTDSNDMLETMIMLIAKKMDELKETPRELTLKGSPESVKIMTEACGKYGITVVDPNQQQHEKSDDSPDPKKEAKLKIPTEENPEYQRMRSKL